MEKNIDKTEFDNEDYLSIDSGIEIEKIVEKAAGSVIRKSSIINGIISILLIIVIVGGAVYFINRKINEIPTFSDFLAFSSDADSHDMILDNNGIFGYSAADFEDAIIGKCEQQVKLEVYSVEVSDVVELTQTGFVNWEALQKTQFITYAGKTTYTVDLSKLSKSSVEYDEENKTIIMRIPHADQGVINVQRESIKFGDVKRGVLAIGDMKFTPEQLNAVETQAVEKMQTKLDEKKEQDNADRFAKLSVWEIYQPIVKNVSKDFALIVEFCD